MFILEQVSVPAKYPITPSLNLAISITFKFSKLSSNIFSGKLLNN